MPLRIRPKYARKKGPLLGFEPTKRFLIDMVQFARFENVRVVSEAPHKGETRGRKANNHLYLAADDGALAEQMLAVVPPLASSEQAGALRALASVLSSP